MSTYGQFCPVAKAMELLDERWTLLVVRELLAGSTHFNELRRGNPRMSPALLAKRLRTLERAGVVRRHDDAGRPVYGLTAAGEELRPVVEALGAWGVRWIGELGEDDLDPHLLFWDVRRTVPVETWPREPTVVEFRLDDVERAVARWWLLVRGGEADLCDVDPGLEPTVVVRSGLRVLTRVWRGDTSWEHALRSGAVVIEGPATARRSLPRWIGQGDFARVPRPAA
ncbi:helix-turn-helix domain-containing protein [Cellulosimicrobium sp. CUA-896]|uniref:winged helix-turn-helix transcriptional regulator n=1 Tax=Cellulosimicrobium sp. CUA-896 TaxID=1517881 RepID=UPI0009677A8B|nr:helix-turn-helix domain-containing protein [Cellulosimicrobium sp. CUA-896]OLT47609.1 HxlR family transcriptional regulator [Cellulosimicrobium sp. CUA-896]